MYLLLNYHTMIENDIAATTALYQNAIDSIAALTVKMKTAQIPYQKELAEATVFARSANELAAKAKSAAVRTRPDNTEALFSADKAAEHAANADALIKPYAEFSDRLDALAAERAGFSQSIERGKADIPDLVAESAASEAQALQAELRAALDYLGESIENIENSLDELKAVRNRAKALKQKNTLLARFKDSAGTTGAGNESLAHIDSSGRTMIFDYAGNGVWKNGEREWPYITSVDGCDALDSAGFILHERSGETHSFDGSGLLASVIAPSGKTTSIERNAAGEPTSVRHLNRTWNITCTGGAITKISMPATPGFNARTHLYGYADDLWPGIPTQTETPRHTATTMDF